MKIASIVGARPNFIKYAPLSKELRKEFMRVRLSIYGPKNQKKRLSYKKYFGHRLTQINADENHKLLIIFGCSALLCSVTVKRSMKNKNKKDKSV